MDSIDVRLEITRIYGSIVAFITRVFPLLVLLLHMIAQIMPRCTGESTLVTSQLLARMFDVHVSPKVNSCVCFIVAFITSKCLAKVLILMYFERVFIVRGVLALITEYQTGTMLGSVHLKA